MQQKQTDINILLGCVGGLERSSAVPGGWSAVAISRHELPADDGKVWRAAVCRPRGSLPAVLGPCLRLRAA